MKIFILRRCILSTLVLCSAVIVLAADSEMPVDAAADKVAEKEAADPFAAFRAFDAMLSGAAINTGTHTSAQRAEAEAELLAKFDKIQWTVPMIIQDVVFDGKSKAVLTFNGIDSAVGKRTMTWQAGNITLAMSKAESLALKVGQVVHLSGEPNIVLPTGLPLTEKVLGEFRLSATPLESRNTSGFGSNGRPQSRIVVLKNVKLTAVPKSGIKTEADKTAANKAGSDQTINNNPADRFQQLWAFDAALLDYGAQLKSLTSLQRVDVEKEFEEKIDATLKAPWTVPLVIRNVMQNQVVAEQIVVDFKSLDESTGNLAMDWKPKYVSLPLPKADALALKIGQVVFLTGKPRMVRPNRGESGFTIPEGTTAMDLVLNVTSKNDQREVPSGHLPSRLIILKDVKLSTE